MPFRMGCKARQRRINDPRSGWGFGSDAPLQTERIYLHQHLTSDVGKGRDLAKNYLTVWSTMPGPTDNSNSWQTDRQQGTTEHKTE